MRNVRQAEIDRVLTIGKGSRIGVKLRHSKQLQYYTVVRRLSASMVEAQYEGGELDVVETSEIIVADGEITYGAAIVYAGPV
jgi:hypothetical protein